MNQEEQTVQSMIINKTDPTNGELRGTLAMYNLEYRNDYNLLVCTQCRHALGVSFNLHCRQHGVMISLTDQGQSCFKEKSIYLLPNQPPLPPLDFLPTSDGVEGISVPPPDIISWKMCPPGYYFLGKVSPLKEKVSLPGPIF